jgi:hypothetical protein
VLAAGAPNPVDAFALCPNPPKPEPALFVVEVPPPNILPPVVAAGAPNPPVAGFAAPNPPLPNAPKFDELAIDFCEVPVRSELVSLCRLIEIEDSIPRFQKSIQEERCETGQRNTTDKSTSIT